MIDHSHCRNPKRAANHQRLALNLIHPTSSSHIPFAKIRNIPHNPCGYANFYTNLDKMAGAVPCHIFFGGFSFVVGATIYIGGSNNKQKSFRSISRFYYFFLRRVKEIFGMQRHTLTMVRKRLPVFSSSRRCVSMAPVLSSPQPHSNSSAIIFLVIKRLNHLAEKYSFFV